MASARIVQKWNIGFSSHKTVCSKCDSNQKQAINQPFLSLPISRRCAILLSSVPTFNLISVPRFSEAMARERRNRKKIPIEDYNTTPEGLKYFDIEEGKGPVAEKGSTVQVHFDCLYRGITAVSSRESKLLAGNRIISQESPTEHLTIGIVPVSEFWLPYSPGSHGPFWERKETRFCRQPNGLFSAQAAPKPPPAMYSVTEGMKLGGKRTVIVPPEAGYGQKGMNEIPPGAEFELISSFCK
ncbi:Peptidyl-prolyl cis-trans isomerase FKBP18 [Hibiscus syriacus]|uniref:peptidylprolyl isomerase n=1 Tax=Hibiscus syriacus TaxID=106335 RepID=A0A6A3CW64_HIBSY|nr:Peptidyl-prolyl cis-trans isomerase FKBP18 [Hibiscus syriacus]